VKGTQVLWFDAVGSIPIRIGIPIELTSADEATSVYVLTSLVN
jgi:hypothetical protein